MSLQSRCTPTPTLAFKPQVRTLALLCALGAPTVISARVAPIPFESEGIVKGIYNRPDGTGVELTVFGRTFLVPPGATIHTPTKSLTAAELVDPSRFPGLYRDGFVGSTAILLGEVTLSADATTATPVIKDVAIEPAETVLLGTLTRNDAGVVSALDIPLLPSTDPRLRSTGNKNEFGYTVAVDVVDLVRANFRLDKSRWEMRGTTNQAGAQVTAVHVRTGATIATVTSDVTGAWQIDVRNSPILAVAGDIVRVTSSGGGTDQEVVNIVQ